MKTRYALATILAAGMAIVIVTDSAFGRGGRGGGGGFGGGGGGRVGGGGGGFSGGGRPSGGFSGGAPGGGFSGGARPNVGSAPSFNRPSAPAARPNPGFGGGPGVGSRPSIGGGPIGGGNRPSLQPGNRPAIGGGPSIGNRPGTLPGGGIGSGPGIGGIGNRPGVGGGVGPGIGNRPGPGGGFGPGNGIGSRPGPGGGFGPGNGIANRPGQGFPGNRLPGLGDAGIGSRLPNQGARVQDRMANRDLTISDRRSNLQDRMANGRQDWQQNRQGRQDDRQEWRNQNREDWQNWADDKMNNYGDWYHGSWYPGAGWGYMWDNYPVAAALGMTAWGINRIGYGWGYYGYDNPYYSESSGYGYDYSQPLVVYSDTPSAGTDVASADPTTTAPPADPGMSAFDAARASFYSGDYQTALAQLDITLKTMPNDAVVHEFRGLVLFALKKYPEAAAAVYSVLAAGPGWDWTTMSSLYPSVDTYSNQLRALENFVRANPQSPDGRFLAGYHYMTNGYSDAANKQFKLAQGLLPTDKLIGQLVAMTAPSDPSKQVAAAAPVPPAGNALQADQFVGAWKASSHGSDFQLDLGQDGSFTWTYTKGKRKQTVKGVYAVDQNNLALETDDGGGAMLAQVDFSNPSQFTFKMIGDKPTDPGLEFKRS